MAKIRTPPDQTIVVKPHVQYLANALEAEFGVTNFGTYLGHSYPEGPTQAIDIFTPDNSAGYGLQDRICEFIRNNVKRFGGRYHIRRHAIWNIERASEGYRDQGVTGNRTTDHMDHVHDTQYAWAPGPFGSSTPTPQQPTTVQGEDMLIVNVHDTGIFMLRGDKVQHLQHPDHVLEWVKAGVSYQDKAEMSRQVFEAYAPEDTLSGMQPLLGGLTISGEGAEEVTYEQQLVQVRAGLDQMKQDYYDMMLADQ